MNEIAEGKQSEVQQMMVLLQERIIEVRDLSEELGKRLAPIRRAIPPTPGDPKQETAGTNTPLTGMMKDQAGILKVSIDQMKAILRTLEL